MVQTLGRKRRHTCTAFTTEGRGNTTTYTGQSYGYDAASRLTAQSTLGLAGGTTTAWLSYTPASQIYAHTTSDEQLSANAAYNVGRAYTANGLDQYTRAGAPGLAYDANANLTRLAATTYAYDGDNLLTGGSAGVGLLYDPLDRLFQSPDDNVTLWAYASGMLAGEYTPSGALKRRYLPGDAGDEVLVQYEGSGTTRRYLATDERGSVTEISNDAGTTLAINQYDDWGIPASGNMGRFGFTGQTWLPSVQAWNYKARIYNPILGRFAQTDPIGYQAGPNWYAYAGNDPQNEVDPGGLQAVAADLYLLQSTNQSSQQPSTPVPPGASTTSAFGSSSSFYSAGGDALASIAANAQRFVTRGPGPVGGVPQKQYLDPGKVEGDPLSEAIMAGGIGRALGVAEAAAAASDDIVVTAIVARQAASLLPEGMTAARFGQIAGFPTGLEASSSALSQGVFARISAARTAGRNLRAAGVSSTAVSTYAKFYAQQAAANPGNVSAVYRAKVLGWLAWFY